MSFRSGIAATFISVAASLAPASAGIVTYTGEDVVATTTSAHPLSAAAAASFDAAVAGLGTGSLVTFEGASLGAFSNLTIAPGVTIDGTDLNGDNQTIRDTSNSPGFPTLDGYNTTAGGSTFVEIEGGTLTFTFSTGVEAFGAYLSGVQDFFPAESITFSDGASESIAVPEAGTSGSVGALDFVGFTDVGKSITSITINAGSATTGADFIGIDDVRFLTVPTVTATPEPGSIWLTVAGLVALGFVMLRRRAASQA